MRDSATGDIIIKLVNGAQTPRVMDIELVGFEPGKYQPAAIVTTLAGTDPEAVNDYDNPSTILPVQSTLRPTSRFTHEVPVNSLTVIRLKAAR